MANTYTTTGSFQTVKVLSQDQVLDVEAIGINTLPSNVRLTVPVPLAAYKSGNADQYLAIVSDLIEGLIASTPDPNNHLVSGAVGTQQVDPSGLLAYFVNFTVSYTPTSGQQGTFSEVVTLPVSIFESEGNYGAPYNGKSALIWIEEAYDRLKKLAHS